MIRFHQCRVGGLPRQTMGPIDYLDEGARLTEDLDNFRERAEEQKVA